ncbi:MAG: hypothetical protein OSJ44_15070 [Lachnospiraceae bacterium]|nr:hypothetical protein [Lachnospiraceae bacterium]
MGEDRRRKRNRKEQNAYVEQLKAYKSKGIPIYIDGREMPKEKDWY